MLTFAPKLNNMGLVQDFKNFAFKGNVVDLAVAVVIGGAFGKIVTSLVEDVITPLLLNPALKALHAENIAQLTWNGVKYGNFLSSIISFFIIAVVLFWVVKTANRINPPQKADVPKAPSQEQLLTEIRDLLQNKTL